MSVPAFNLMGQSIFTEVRNHGSACLDLGPAIRPGIKIRPLPNLTEELTALREKMGRGQEPSDIAHDFERLLINAGMPEIIGTGNILYSIECSQASEDIMYLASELRETDAVFSARTENLLGNLAWLRSPAFYGKRGVDSKARSGMLAGASNDMLGYYDRAIALEPEFMIAHKNRAMLLFLARRDEETIEACKTVNEHWPDDNDTWTLRGIAYLRTGELSEAIRCFDSSLMISAKDSVTWMHKAQALVGMEKLAEALACFDKSLKLEPHNPEVLNGRGDALTRLGKIDLAVESYDRAKNMMQKPAFIPRKTTKPAAQISETPSPPEFTIRMAEPEPIQPPPMKVQEEIVPEPATEEHPPEKMAKEPVELDMEAELEAA
ncbi:MAG: tetratricopeptide repeat protein, partial [Candidatus Thermoplasmatota archaeon]|nr:tetratricopeptide repeat protein [Candidatus Thermoplasmatota archaeon]